jgi:hypothetical protein
LVHTQQSVMDAGPLLLVDEHPDPRAVCRNELVHRPPDLDGIRPFRHWQRLDDARPHPPERERPLILREHSSIPEHLALSDSQLRRRGLERGAEFIVLRRQLPHLIELGHHLPGIDRQSLRGRGLQQNTT